MGQEHASIAYFTFRLIVLLLIRKSISSLRRHIEKVPPVFVDHFIPDIFMFPLLHPLIYESLVSLHIF